MENITYFKPYYDRNYICCYICNISNKITNESFEGIDSQDIIEREKPNE